MGRTCEFIGECCNTLQISDFPDRQSAAIAAAENAGFPVENALGFVCQGDISHELDVVAGTVSIEAATEAVKVCRKSCSRYGYFQGLKKQTST